MPDFLIHYLTNPVTAVCLVICVLTLGAGAYYVVTSPKEFMLGLKNLFRNFLRTALISAATMLLVAMFTLIWSVVWFMDEVTTERSKDLKLIITERWQVPSMMPMTHANYLDPENPSCIVKEFITPNDFMTWSFYGGTLDKEKMTRENIIFFFVMKAKHILTMMDDVENLDPALVKKLGETRNGCLVGPDRLKAMKKQVGDRITVTSMNYKGIDLEFEIVGMLPDGRQAQSAIMNEEYFNQSLDKYAVDRRAKHPLDGKRLNLIWLRVKDRETFDKVGALIESSEYFADRPVKVQTASSGVASFLDAYRDIFNLVKWLVVPALLLSMGLINAIAISLSVRERRTEMAVLKVLGFRPMQILKLVLGEALLIGAFSGLVSAAFTYVVMDWVIGGIKIPVGFFPSFMVPHEALFWGLAIGAGTAFAGSFLPAFQARSVKVSEVFAKVA